MSSTIPSRTLPAALSKVENLPSLPAVAIEILRLSQDENAGAEDLTKALERDPALAAKMLKLANSSLFNTGRETTNLREAVVRLGLKTVRLMALSFSLVSDQSGRAAQASLLGDYWRNSLTLATASRALASAARLRTGDEAFLCGLLAHLGQLVLLEVMPEEYARVLKRADGRWPTLADEEAELGLHRGHIVEALQSSWGLPLKLRNGSQWALGLPTQEPPTSPEELSLHQALKMGGLATQLLVGGGGATSLRSLIEEAERAGLSETGLHSCLMILENDMREMASLFRLTLPPGRDYNSILTEARGQIVNVSLGAVADLQRERSRSEALESANRELAEAASTDGLTGIANRAAFDRFLQAQVDNRAHGGVPKALGLLMVDVDHFKRFNDTFGHACGDKVLRIVAQVLRRGLRANDLAARYGGEEFAIVFPEITPIELASAAERLRAALESQMLEFDGRIATITASFGCSFQLRTQAGDTGVALCAAADKALYRAKEQGRNRVVVGTAVS